MAIPITEIIGEYEVVCSMENLVTLRDELLLWVILKMPNGSVISEGLMIVEVSHRD